MFHNSNWIELTNRESGSNRKYPRHRTVKYVEWNLGCKWNGIVDLRWKEMRFNDIGVISSIEAKRSWKSCCWLDRNARASYSLKRIEAMLPAITQRAPGKWKSNNRTQRRVAYKDSFAAALRMKIQSRRTDVGRWCRTLMSGDDVERWINRDGSYQPVFWFAPVCKMRFVRWRSTSINMIGNSAWCALYWIGLYWSGYLSQVRAEFAGLGSKTNYKKLITCKVQMLAIDFSHLSPGIVNGAPTMLMDRTRSMLQCNELSLQGFGYPRQPSVSSSDNCINSYSFSEWDARKPSSEPRLSRIFTRSGSPVFRLR